MIIVSSGIPDGSISTAKLADGAVTTNKVADGTLVAADLSATAGVAGSQLAAAANIAGSQLAAGTLRLKKMYMATFASIPNNQTGYSLGAFSVPSGTISSAAGALIKIRVMYRITNALDTVYFKIGSNIVTSQAGAGTSGNVHEVYITYVDASNKRYNKFSLSSAGVSLNIAGAVAEATDITGAFTINITQDTGATSAVVNMVVVCEVYDLS